MTDRALARWAQASFALIAAPFVVSVVIAARFEIDEVSWGIPGLVGQVLLAITMLTFPVVGVLVVSRQPRHRIGWLLLAIGAVWGAASVTDAWIGYGERADASYLDLLLALTSWLWVPAVGLMAIYLVLLFPDGRLPSPRWRWLGWASGVVITLVSIVTVFGSRNFADVGRPEIENPLYVAQAPPPVLVVPLLPLCMVACTGALIYRFQRSRGIERLQLKWFVAAAASAAALAALVVGASMWQGAGSSNTPLWVQVIQQIELSSFGLLPVATGIAILRYRLYDIDVVINRTIVYATLLAVLGVVYAVGIYVVGGVLRTLTGSEDDQLAVAASTLAVAAAFRPALGRIRSVIDRRFYRRRYDSMQVLEAFNARLRDQVSLDALSADLVGVVARSMQPAHVSLWLKDTGQPETAT